MPSDLLDPSLLDQTADVIVERWGVVRPSYEGFALCGRFNLRATPAELQQFFDLMREPDPFPILYNIAPTQTVLAIRETKAGRVAIPHRWVTSRLERPEAS